MKEKENIKTQNTLPVNENNKEIHSKIDNQDNEHSDHEAKFKLIKSKAETVLKVLKYVLAFFIVVTLVNVIANIADIYHKNFVGWLVLSIVSISVSVGLVIALICLYTDINKTIKKYNKK